MKRVVTTTAVLNVGERIASAMDWSSLKFELSEHQKTRLSPEHREQVREAYQMMPTVIKHLEEHGPKKFTELCDELAPHWRETKKRDIIRNSLWDLLDRHLIIWYPDGRWGLREEL